MEREIMMTINQMLDLGVTLVGVALVIVVAVYTKYKIQIDKKAQQGDLIAKAEQVVARAVEPLVYQAEKMVGQVKLSLIGYLMLYSLSWI
ncbi:phage holin [Lactobacillus helveticus]|uniref:phage holin n=1 Tax=Lactobacillus helveticus TaxID=1587 RepID=UPI0019EEC30D|nr:phage holin [Lactobacillus helveticus]NRO05385.1 hypothetical protein [Lactobacillus helveticus]